MKITKKSKLKIQNRYNTKFTEYSNKTRDEVKGLLEQLGKGELKLSTTDTQALWDAASYIMQKDREKQLTELETKPLEMQIESEEKQIPPTENTD